MIFSAVKPGVVVDELPPHAEFFAVTNEELPPTEELPPGVVPFVSLVELTAEKVCPLSSWFLLPRPKECVALRTNPARNLHKPGG